MFVVNFRAKWYILVQAYDLYGITFLTKKQILASYVIYPVWGLEKRLYLFNNHDERFKGNM